MNRLPLLTLCLSACFADPGETSGGTTSDDATDTSGSTDGSGSTTGSGSSSEGSTSDADTSTGSDTSTSGSDTSTGSTGGGLPPVDGMYEPCELDTECEPGQYCSPPLGPDGIRGFCTIPCAAEGDPCRPSPLWPTICQRVFQTGALGVDDEYMCGLLCPDNECPDGWRCTHSNWSGYSAPTCYPEG